MDELLSWDGVGRTYDAAVPVVALAPTTLAIGASEYTAVVGPSGSGKSTMLNVLGLLDRPTSGTYRLAGVDVGELPEQGRTALRATCFGFVFQAFHLLAHQSVLENVELGLLYSGVHRRQRPARALEAIDRVGMGHRRDADPSTLSGGERQRVAIARALCIAPRVLLCDEPTGNLDSDNAQQVLALLDALNQDGTAVIVVTHDPTVADHARRVVSMHDGRVARDTAPRASVGPGAGVPVAP